MLGMERVQSQQNVNGRRKKRALYECIRLQMAPRVIPPFPHLRRPSMRTHIPLQATTANLSRKGTDIPLSNLIHPLICNSNILGQRGKRKMSMKGKKLLGSKRPPPHTRIQTLLIMLHNSTGIRIQQPNNIPHHPCTTLLPSKVFTPMRVPLKLGITLSILPYRTRSNTRFKSAPRRYPRNHHRRLGLSMTGLIGLRLVRSTTMQEVQREGRTVQRLQ